MAELRPDRRLELARAWQAIAATEDGMTVIEDLMRFCGDGESAFKTRADLSVCPYQLARAAARREVADRVRRLIAEDVMRLHELIMERAPDE